MAAKFISMRNLKFLLYEVFDAEALTRYPYFRHHNRKMFDMVLDAALKLASNLLLPVFEEMDRKPPELVEGRVRVHPSVRAIMEEFGKGDGSRPVFPRNSTGNSFPSWLRTRAT